MCLRLCVTNIGFHITENVLQEYFGQFGPISECTLKTDYLTGESRGFAFITFTNEQSTKRCLQITSHRIQERAASVFSEEQENLSAHVPRTKKLFISLLGLRSVSESEIYEVFREYGDIASIEFDNNGGLTYPLYCILYFRNHNSVDHCLTRSHCIQGRTVFVKRATSREEVKLAEQRERELQAAKAQAKKVYGAHCPTQNVTIVQPRLFSAAPSLLNNHAAELANSTSRKRPTGDSRMYQPTASKKVDLSGYGYV